MWRAFIKSSNFYFITNGMKAGIENIVRLGQRLHLGERTGLLNRQETAGSFPTLNVVRRGWIAPDTALLCIGQGRIDVTPLQIAVMVGAVANGGKVLWPRLVQRIELTPLLAHYLAGGPTGGLTDGLTDGLAVRP